MGVNHRIIFYIILIIRLYSVIPMSQLTLYWHLGSQPGRAVKTILDLGNIPCQYISVDLSKRQHKKSTFLQLYPTGKIPFLKDGEFGIGQSSAILVYLCEKYPKIKKYHGQTVQKRAIVNQYISWYQHYFRNAIYRPFRLYFGAAIYKQNIAYHHIKALFNKMWEAFQKLQIILTVNQTIFIAGNSPTIADFLILYEITTLTYFGLNYQKYPKVKTWANAVISIPTVNQINQQWKVVAEEVINLFSQVKIVDKNEAKL